MNLKAIRVVLPILVLAIAFDVVSARRSHRGRRHGSDSVCESRGELNSCKKDCYMDRDCNDSSNLNCDRKCKQACDILEDMDRCDGALLAIIVRQRGRLSGGGGGRFSSGRGRTRSGGSGSSGRRRDSGKGSRRSKSRSGDGLLSSSKSSQAGYGDSGHRRGRKDKDDMLSLGGDKQHFLSL